MSLSSLKLIVVLLSATSVAFAVEPADESTNEVVLARDVAWRPLNPLRGDKGPKAGTLWGDQTRAGASGFLVKFVDGFASPPHIHNISYRGLVIGGLLHNDDPDAEPMWMPAGSYWTQPAGEPHITAARGVSVAYVEIQDGPYLVRPADQAFDNGERPVNVDASNLVWLDATDTSWLQAPAEGGPVAEIAFLWGDFKSGRLNGSLLKLPPGFRGVLQSEESTLRVVVIEGQVQRQAVGESAAATLDPGGYFASAGEAPNRISSDAETESLIYVRSQGRFTLRSEAKGD